MPTDVQYCDNATVASINQYSSWCAALDNCIEPPFQFPDQACPSGRSLSVLGECCKNTPIVVDLEADGFDLTDAAGGVAFDIGGDGLADHIAWTAPDSDDAWLALDRNGNGVIDNGTELFGNSTPQPWVAEPNGFTALLQYDRPENGGNGDGSITAADAVFAALRLWQDFDHDGYSATSELRSLEESGVTRIDLDYKVSKRTDEHGNEFRYRAKVYDSGGHQVGRWAWDVILSSL